MPKTAGWARVAVLCVLLRFFQPQKAHAEDRVEYRFEDYNEDNNRIHVRTHSAIFEKELTSKIVVRGMAVYDGISGATPTGQAPSPGANVVPLVQMHDIRRALNFDTSIKYGRNTTTPGISYSEESDYISRGFSLNHTIDFNDKNTTLVFGAGHNFDSVSGGPIQASLGKETTDILLGINQLLSPTTVFSANVSFGYAEGYLADPYRVASFILPDSPEAVFSDPANSLPQAEVRPRHRFKQVGLLSLTQAIKPLGASVEGEYRIYHDDWGIVANTVTLTWFQEITKYVTVSPNVRYYRQTAADFYAPAFRGLWFPQYAGGTQVEFVTDPFTNQAFFYAFGDDPFFDLTIPGSFAINAPARPSYYSSDYRLSELEAWTVGFGLQVRIAEHFTIDAAYKYYEMHGLDHVTLQAAYPKANIFTIGCGVWF